MYHLELPTISAFGTGEAEGLTGKDIIMKPALDSRILGEKRIMG